MKLLYAKYSACKFKGYFLGLADTIGDDCGREEFFEFGGCAEGALYLFGNALESSPSDFEEDGIVDFLHLGLLQFLEDFNGEPCIRLEHAEHLPDLVCILVGIGCKP